MSAEENACSHQRGNSLPVSHVRMRFRCLVEYFMRMIMHAVVATGLLAIAANLQAHPHQNDSTGGKARGATLNSGYRDQLLQLAAADQKLRTDTLGRFTPQQLQSDPGAARALALQIHASQQQNQRRLAELMAQHGFPDTDAVGEDGAHAAFVVAQHSPDRAFRQEFLKGIEAAAEKDAYDRADLALFVDRNRVLTGQPQLYGTQHKADGSLFEIERPEQLQERRATMGLPPTAPID